MMTVHIEGIDCGARQNEDTEITRAEALDPNDDRHFDCVACHKVLTDNQKHSRPS